MNAHAFPNVSPAGAASPNHLAAKAMLAGIKISMWAARKVDQKVTDETNRAHNADADAGRYNKALLSKHALSEIQEIAGRARRELYSRTLPWADNGNRILSAAGYDEFTKAMRKLESDFADAVARFVAEYPSFVADAKARLNGMFNPADYPDASEIAGRFKFKRQIWPMPQDSDFRVDMTAGERERIQAEIAAELGEAMRDAMKDVYQRIADTVGAMASKLAAFKPAEKKGDKSEGIFRDSLVENVRELAALLPSLNVTGDPALMAIAARMEKLTEHDAEALREDSTLRREIADAAAEINATVSDYLA
ncbi:hypothetical protein MesoLjLc_51190 [Mesorhizobium sp. L-8-10]|uniref:DUF3150 domain-containing protein n=1 Tax=Mesorhizobium sp. L-8-10 TaxID=2744523 RepID=UPI001926E828|nr:DUF3150 domain-containing protein [Mesorhizobium sp. L-8-10]BCH33189.1 hypothetical protein MesoLjLc_51190 [Mesorhizobium sp. L-8-10]